MRQQLVRTVVARDLLVPALVGGLAGVGGTLLSQAECSRAPTTAAPNPQTPATAAPRPGPAIRHTLAAPLRVSGTIQEPVAEADDPEPAEPTEATAAQPTAEQRHERYVEPFLLERRDQSWAGAAERTLASNFHDYRARWIADMPGRDVRSLECRESRCLAQLSLPGDARAA
jgi:hypothetical protein